MDITAFSNSNPNKRANDFNIEHFRIRKTARVGIVLVCLLLFIPRIPAIVANSTIPAKDRLLMYITLFTPLLITFIVVFEYFLSKKLGPRIVKYSNLFDILLLLTFTADWIIILIASLDKIQKDDPVCFQVGALFGFISFSWRTLMVTLIVQNWLLKIIPLAIATSLSVGYAIYYSPETLAFTLLSGITQLVNVIIIIYCDDKVKWEMLWANIQKDKWMQVNNFILNSIPENIMILDIAGETKFSSESCQSFIKSCHLSLDAKEFFRSVRGLSQQKCDPPITSVLQIERLTTVNELLTTEIGEKTNSQILEDTIKNFQNSIVKKEIHERQFQVYNGKLRIENQKEKSLEVKISFVQHFENHYIVLIIRDMTQRDLLIASEETNKYKDQLLASVSHELRAPLNGNINLVESAVNSGQTTEKVKEDLLIPALRSSKFLLHIINDILDMSQINEKKLRLVFQSENLKETIKSSVQLVELQAKKKGIELLLDIDPSLPKTFSTDHIRLGQIILNLLNNAIKFTKEGAVKLIAKRIEESSSVKITVEDSGIGMDQENLQKLFSSYTHIDFDGRQNMNPTGVGLGLNIAYNLALLLGPQDHQGISVTSVPGQGSTFTFFLENKQPEKVFIEQPSLDRSEDLCDEIADELSRPVRPMSFPRMQRISSGNSNSIAPVIEKCNSSIILNNHNACVCPKVLVVDDNPFNTMACETILDSLNIKCDSVYSGSACLKNLLNRQTKPCGEHCMQYAVIIMYQEMPEMSGSDTVNEIKRLQAENLLSREIKIVGCTAHKSKEEVDKFMEAGLDQCIHKPISTEMLKEIFKGIPILEK